MLATRKQLRLPLKPSLLCLPAVSRLSSTPSWLLRIERPHVAASHLQPLQAPRANAHRVELAEARPPLEETLDRAAPRSFRAALRP